jgi:hypothetical protein
MALHWPSCATTPDRRSIISADVQLVSDADHAIGGSRDLFCRSLFVFGPDFAAQRDDTVGDGYLDVTACDR